MCVWVRLTDLSGTKLGDGQLCKQVPIQGMPDWSCIVCLDSMDCYDQWSVILDALPASSDSVG